MFLLEPNGSYVALRSSATRLVHHTFRSPADEGATKKYRKSFSKVSSDAEKKNASKKVFFFGKKNPNKAEIEKG